MQQDSSGVTERARAMRRAPKGPLCRPAGPPPAATGRIINLCVMLAVPGSACVAFAIE